MNAFIPYGIYWSTPFAKWQGSLANMHSIKLAARSAVASLLRRNFPLEAIDLAVLGITNPQPSSFFGLPWLTGMMGLENVAGPTVQQACATGVRAMQMAAQEVACGTANCALVVAADRCSNGAIVYYPDATAPGGKGVSEAWVVDNFGNDPHAHISMVQTADRVAKRFDISTAEQHDVVLRRHEQYQDALADDRSFQRRYMIDVTVMDASFRKELGVLSADEGVFPTTAEGLARLKPVRPDGSVTFGGQTHPADGNAGLVVTSRQRAREYSSDPAIEVEILGFGMARAEKGHMPMAVPPTAQAALRATGLSMKDIDAVKTHNPFAVNDVLLARESGFPVERINNFGSSLIWGHPQGPTGARSVVELIEELALRGGGTGLFVGCAAGDSGMGVVLRVTDSRR